MTVADLPLRPREDARELLRTVDLTKHFRLGGFLSSRYLHGVDGINLSIHEDEIVALVGESGSGKSTIARLIAGVYKPTAGDILHRGQSVKEIEERRVGKECRARGAERD